MKIAIIQPRTSYFVSGSEKISLKHAEFLAKIGHSVDLYTTNYSGIRYTNLFNDFLEKNIKNVEIFSFDTSKIIPGIYDIEPDREHVRWVTESIAFDRLIFETLNKNKPDIILSYYLPDSLFKPLLIPNVVYLSGYSKDPVLAYKSYIKSCDATISISKVVAEKWSDNLKKVKMNYLLGTGVDFPPIFEEKVVPIEKYNLVFAGRLIERKGILTLLEAFEEIVKIQKDIHLWILGDGELREKIENEVRNKNLENKVTITGFVNNPSDYFNIADICVFPSHEGDGLMGTVLESMSCGKSIIATTDNGNEDVITNGFNGLLIKPRDVEELVSTVCSLIADKTKRNILGNNAKNFIAENVAWENNIIKLSDLFRDIIEEINSKK
jgi:glycosyltransferase involved in cell wall biosynthesis